MGPWCFANHPRHRFRDQIKFTVAPSPWKTSKDVLDASRYIDSLIDRLIPPLSAAMNDAFGVRYRETFWKTYLIDWLLHWLGHCYDRYRRLACLAESVPETLKVKALERGSVAAAGNVQSYLIRMATEHGCNLQLFSDILRLGRFDRLSVDLCPGRIDPEERADGECGRRRPNFPDVLNEAERRAVSLFNGWCFGKVHLGIVSGVSVFDRFRMAFAGNPLFFLTGKWQNAISVRRGRVVSVAPAALEFDGQNEFERMIRQLLFEYLPAAYLVEYLVDEKRLSGVKTWVGNDLYRGEEVSYLIARIREGGGRWISVQHGGGYGTSFAFPLGKIEYETSDGFVTWGWSFRHLYTSSYHALPAPNLSKLPKHRRRKDELIFVGTCYYPYDYRLSSKLRPEDLLAYWENRVRFFERLDRAILEKVAYRPHGEQPVGGELEFVRPFIKEGRILAEGRLTDHLQQTKIAVIDHMETSILESLSMNAPTIAFWNREQYALTPEAAPYFEPLYDAGILHDDPADAARKVNEIWEDVERWWRRPSVQTAKDDFCRHFARTSRNWRSDWSSWLSSIQHASAGRASRRGVPSSP